MNLIGHIPSPYGVPMAVYRDPNAPADSDDCYHHDIDGCMTLAGIHGLEARTKCKAAIHAASGKGRVPFSIFEEHGGRKIPREPLPMPWQPIYPKLPHTHGMDLPIENWVTLVLDFSQWDKRAAALLDIIAGNTKAAAGWDMPPEILGFGLQHLLTAALEHLGETEIDCLEAAALYAVTLHDEWSESAVRWLSPIRDSWLADWITARPRYRDFAKVCQSINPDLPSWIGGAQ